MCVLATRLCCAVHTKVCRMLSSCIAYKIKFLEFKSTICLHCAVNLLKFTCTPVVPQKFYVAAFPPARISADRCVHHEFRTDANGHWIIQDSPQRCRPIAPG